MRRAASVTERLTGVMLLLALMGGGPAEGRGAVPQEPMRQGIRQPGDTIDLTLDQAIAVAERNNPGYRRAVNQLDVGGAESRAVWMGSVLPSISLNVLNTGYNGRRVLQSQDVFGNPIENTRSDWFLSSSTTQSIGLSWSVQGKSSIDAVRRLEVDDRGRELEVDAAILQVRGSVRRQYLAVLREGELLDVEVASLEGRQRDQDAAEQRFRFAQATRIDVLNAELAVEEQDRAIRTQQRALDQVRLSLRTTLGDPDLPPFRVASESLPLFDPAELEDDVLVARALAAHPQVRQAAGDLEGARLGVSEAKASRWPRLSFGYNLGRQAQASEGAALFDVTNEPNDLTHYFSIGLSFPYLSNYFQNRRSEVQAEVILRNQQETLRETRLQVEEDVRTQLIALRNQYETLASNRRRLEIATEALQLAREQYRLGTLTFSELQDQVDTERDARRESITAGYAFQDALLDLEAAVGGPVRGGPAQPDDAGDGFVEGPDVGGVRSPPTDDPLGTRNGPG